MSEGGVCSWCEGVGTLFEGTEIATTCEWCDGTGVQKPNFYGHVELSEHRTVGPIRAWCECGEWCYVEGFGEPCRCCNEHHRQTQEG